MRALVTGARGQDGTLLGELLVSQGFEVLGLVRPGSRSVPTPDGPELRHVDLTDDKDVRRIFADFKPDHVYHLAASHHSSDEAGSAACDREMVATNFRAAEILLGAIVELRPSCRLLLAGSSQMYQPKEGRETRVDEMTPMSPATFYGHTKAWSRELLAQYRARHGVFGSMVILFNHESPLRGRNFVSRKVSIGAAQAKSGDMAPLQLRDVTAKTDWSSATDVVRGMLLALTADEPGDYVLASGVARRLEDLLDVAFRTVGLDWRDYVDVDPSAKPSSGALVGDATRARTALGWKPVVGFDQMIADMVAFDMSLLQPAQA